MIQTASLLEGNCRRGEKKKVVHRRGKRDVTGKREKIKEGKANGSKELANNAQECRGSGREKWVSWGGMEKF